MPATRTLRLSTEVVATLRGQLPAVATQTVGAIIAEVPSYAVALDGPMGSQIEQAVQLALGGFLDLAARHEGTDPSSPLQSVLDASYGLGRGEARSGRSMDALLAAYRVGARVSWRELSTLAVTAGLPAQTMAQFAELVFAYIDELSAASVSGHADELATTGRVRQRYLDSLARSLLAGDDVATVRRAADRARWEPPAELAALVLPEGHARGITTVLDPRSLIVTGDLAGPDGAIDEELVVLLVPGSDRVGRAQLKASLTGRHATLGPCVDWTQAQVSYHRALRARRLIAADGGRAGVLDTEDHLPELVLSADPGSLEDLRRQLLAPLADLSDTSGQKLAETLRAWLLHQGRRDEVAAALFVHPQTVRYRMGQLRELYAERLDDPQIVLGLTLALGTATAQDVAAALAPVAGGDDP